MRSLEIGLVLPMGDSFVDGSTIHWSQIRDLAIRAEEVGFDTVWTADELLWRPEGGGRAQGWWECLSMTGAVAAATSRIKVGTWIMSALHHNPAIMAKAVETLDEITGGRFVFGLGAGHAGQGHAFGLPEDRTVGRFEEALQIILPLLREGRADFEGEFYAARDLEQRPRGPRSGAIPIMIGAKGPRMLRLAARHADIWSWFVEERSDLTEFGPRLTALEAACAEVGRDPATIGRSAGIVVEPTSVTAEGDVLGTPIRGSTAEIADALLAFREGGFDHLELLPWPPTIATIHAMAPVLDRLDAA